MKMSGELYDQDAVRHHNSRHHDHAHERHHVQRAAGEQQDDEHSGEPRRNGHQDDEGVNKGGKLSHEDEVYERDGENEANAEAKERLVHADYGSSHRNANVLRLLHMGDYLVDFAVDVLKRLCRGHHVDIDHTANLVMIHLGGRID